MNPDKIHVIFSSTDFGITSRVIYVKVCMLMVLVLEYYATSNITCVVCTVFSVCLYVKIA